MVRYALILAFFLTGCVSMCQKAHEDMTAEEVLEEYLKIAFNLDNLNERDLLLEYTTGELKAALASAPDEVITQAYIKKRYELKRFSVEQRRDLTPRETELSYQLSYKELQGGNNEELPTITAENTVVLIKENGKWYLRDVIGNKTSIDFPITRDSMIKPSPNSTPPSGTP